MLGCFGTLACLCGRPRRRTLRNLASSRLPPTSPSSTDEHGPRHGPVRRRPRRRDRERPAETITHGLTAEAARRPRHVRRSARQPLGRRLPESYQAISGWARDQIVPGRDHASGDRMLTRNAIVEDTVRFGGRRAVREHHARCPACRPSRTTSPAGGRRPTAGAGRLEGHDGAQVPVRSRGSDRRAHGRAPEHAGDRRGSPNDHPEPAQQARMTSASVIDGCEDVGSRLANCAARRAALVVDRAGLFACSRLGIRGALVELAHLLGSRRGGIESHLLLRLHRAMNWVWAASASSARAERTARTGSGGGGHGYSPTTLGFGKHNT